MKFSLFFLICLTILYLTLSDSKKIVLDFKPNRNTLGNQMDIVFVRRDENNEGKHIFRPTETFSNSPDYAESVTDTWVAVDKQSNQPNTESSKVGLSKNLQSYPDDDDKSAVYSFKKDIASEHLDKKAAKKIRDKTNVLKVPKRKEHKNRVPYVHIRNEHKETKDFIKREKPIKNVKMDFNGKPDPMLNIPLTGGLGPAHIAKELYEIDPVLNILQSDINTRRKEKEEEEDISSTMESSSQEFGNFKEQFQDLWLQKKYEALNSSLPAGDQVFMGGARPWGVACGDPNQHDVPWGSCMLSIECEPEYRIYKGDMYCGRTSFVCCALELTTYDMYQGFDISFEGKSLSQDTEEIKRDTQKKRNNQKKRRNARRRRKKKIKNTIKKIIREINSILNRMYANGSKQKRKKTKQMQRFIKFLKTEYKKNRHVVQEMHEQSMVKIDVELMKKLYDIKDMNHNFMKNQTFADIVVNGTMTKKGARMLIQAYPELQDFINSNSSPAPATFAAADLKNRRFGGAIPDYKEKNIRVDEKKIKSKGDYLEYDVEYGFLYY